MKFSTINYIDAVPVCKSVAEKTNGNIANYNDYINDTKEAINLLENDFLTASFSTYDDIVKWFADNFEMYKSKGNISKTSSLQNIQTTQGLQGLQNIQIQGLQNIQGLQDKYHDSYYRAFLSLQNDVVFVLRITNHYASKDAMMKKYQGKQIKPKFQYHVLIDRIDITYIKKNKKLVDGVTIPSVKGVDVYVLKSTTEDIKNANPDKRKEIINPLLEILKTGAIPSKNNNIVKVDEGVLTFDRFMWYRSITEAVNVF